MRKPSSPFLKRLIELQHRMAPPPGHPLHEPFKEACEREAKYNLQLRLELKQLKKIQQPFVQTRMKGGSGFVVAETIRAFFLEYYSRFVRHGPTTFPSSFNIMESFLFFSERYIAFDLRPEREHLLRFSEYLDWYTSGSFPNEPAALIDIMEEGATYAYNMVDPVAEFSLATPDSSLRVLGVGMIRHADELSVVLVAGENPPYPPDEEIESDRFRDVEVPQGKEQIRPDPSYDIQSRYVDGLDNHVRVLLMARFDLRRGKYDVRYVNIDVGPQYLVYSDDRMIFLNVRDGESYIQEMNESLKRYDQLFSAACSMIFLPAFFIARKSDCVPTRFATEIHLSRTSSETKRTAKILGRRELTSFRSVECLRNSTSAPLISETVVEPPELEFETTGYWRPLSPLEVGEDREGNPVLGKTWVERKESWTASGLDAFVVSTRSDRPAGNDPGRIYIVRSGSHASDVYKIGLTRREVSTRAAELSGATGVPSKFEILAEWEVGDCTTVERVVHERLDPYRINSRREFFKVPLSQIVSAINEAIQ